MGSSEIYKLDKCCIEIDGKVILAPQDYSICTGDFITFSGRSGAGKSTLIQLLLGFMQPTSGRFFYKGADVCDCSVGALRENVAVVFQEPVLMGKTIQSALLEPFTYKRNRKSKPSRKDISDLLSSLEIKLDLDSNISTLSGGEKQRIALARALLMNSEVLVLDEVTSALDEVQRELVFDVVRGCGSTVIAVSHDPGWIENSPRNITITAPDEIGVL